MIMTFLTGKYPRNLLKQRNYVVAESATLSLSQELALPYIFVRLLLTPHFLGAEPPSTPLNLLRPKSFRFLQQALNIK